MHRATPVTFATTLAVASALIAIAPLHAEGSKVVKHTRVPIFGSVSESDSTEWISPQAKRTEGASSIKGGFIGALAKLHRDKQRVVITRLDKGVVWTLDPANQTYTEAPIARYLEPAAEGGNGRQAPPPQEKSSIRVVGADFSVKATGQENTIAGFPCKQSVMDGYIEFEDTESKDRSRWEFHDERWSAAETPAIRHYQEAEREFGRNYMAKLGIATPDARTADSMLQGLMRSTGISGAQLAKATAKLASESAKISGFAIVNHFRWSLSAQNGKPAPAGSGASSGEPAGAPQQGGLSSIFHRNRDSSDSSGNGGLTIEGTTEIRSLSDESGDFTIPAGYRKVDSN
jgi:hypothetical protein